MKYSFIVTVLCSLLVIGGACTHENDPEDGKRTNQTPLIVKATASNSIISPYPDPPLHALPWKTEPKRSLVQETPSAFSPLKIMR